MDLRPAAPNNNGCSADEDEKTMMKDKENNKGKTAGLVAPLDAAQDMEGLEEQGEMVYGIPEARNPAVLPAPHLPHPAEVEQHNVTHCPYRSWCRVCVEAAGREDAHRAGTRDEEGDNIVPTIGFDYDFIGDSGRQINENEFESGRDVVIMVQKDYKSGVIWAHVAKCKGPKDEWLMRNMVMDIESSGQAHIRLKSDGEPSTKAVQKDLIGRRPPPRRTLPVNPPAYDPLANGCIEVGVRDFNVQLRKLKLGLERRLKTVIPASHPLVEWLVEHAAFVHSRIPVHADGKTHYERMHGRKWRGKLLEFGEQVQAKLTRPKPQSKMPRKAGPKFVRATWVGINERTGEHKVVSITGKAFRVRTVKRRPEQVRWQADRVKEIRATPRIPDPDKPVKPDVIELEPANVEDEVKDIAKIPEDIIDRHMADIEATRPEPVREMRLTKRMFVQYGWSPDCPGCKALKEDGPKRKHTEVCRNRLY